MFVNYYGITTLDEVTPSDNSSSQSSFKPHAHELVRVNAGQQLILVSIQICGGQQDGLLTLTKYNNANNQRVLAYSQTLTISKKTPIVLQHKIILPTYYSLQMSGSKAGISVCLNGIRRSTQTQVYNETTGISNEQLGAINNILDAINGNIE